MVVMMNQNDIVAMGAPAVTFHGWNCDGCIRLDSPSAILACLISACDTGYSRGPDCFSIYRDIQDHGRSCVTRAAARTPPEGPRARAAVAAVGLSGFLLCHVLYPYTCSHALLFYHRFSDIEHCNTVAELKLISGGIKAPP